MTPRPSFQKSRFDTLTNLLQHGNIQCIQRCGMRPRPPFLGFQQMTLLLTATVGHSFRRVWLSLRGLWPLGHCVHGGPADMVLFPGSGADV